MKNRYYRPNNLPSRIVYHTQKEFKLDMLFLAIIISIGVIVAVTGFISILLQISPEL
jgi:hypothetical protein